MSITQTMACKSQGPLMVNGAVGGGETSLTKEEISKITQSKSMEMDTHEDKVSPSKLAQLGHSPFKALDKKRLAYEEIVTELKERISSLLTKEDFTESATRSDLKFIQKQSRYNPDVILNRRLVEHMVKYGIAHVFLKVWRSVNTVDYISEAHYLAFKNLQTALSVVWNCSDKSTQFCESLATCGVIQLMLTELNTPRLLKADFGNENLLYLAKAYLGILHNIVRLSSDSRKLFRSSHAMDILKHYLYIDQYMVKTKAYLILSYIITEQENDVINANDENIAFIIDILRDALNSENHFSQKFAFWASEIACGLNHLARNDTNKIRIARLGGLSLYSKMLCSTAVEEQNLGTAGLWILAFHDDNKPLIRAEPGCLDSLQQLATSSPEESVRRAARGALWVIRIGGTAVGPTAIQESAQNNLPHVMISYHWSSQKTMVKVKNKLKTAGFKVWMDIDNMSGSTLEAMALAVEQASVVLVCMTQAYKDSPSCRTEAEYIYRLRKDLIPLVLQSGYAPDGWLGMLVGTRLYFDFSDDKYFETEATRLIKELGNRGKIPSRSTSTVSTRSDDTSAMSPRSAISDSTSCSSLHSYMTKSTLVSGWSCEDVRSWLEGSGLVTLLERFRDFTGEMLVQYKKMQKSAPEHFYHTLEKNLGMDLVLQLRFTKALDDLL